MNFTTQLVAGAGAFAVGALLMWGADRSAGPVPTATPEPAASVSAEPPRPVKPGAVKVELFVMSQCPYGVQAEAAFQEAVTKLGDDLDLRVEYIGNIGPGGQLTSMHGPPEVKGNLVQICAMKHSAKWFDFITCQNENWKAVDTNWEACAKKVGIPVETLRSCSQGSEGNDLLAASFKRAQARGATGSPTIYIGGKGYQGSRKPTDILRAICAEYTGEKPQPCHEIPEPPKVNVTVLGDKRCSECDLAELEQQVKRVIGNPVITKVDYAEPDGKKLFERIKPMNLPALVFDGTLATDPDASMAIAQSLRTVGDVKVIATGDWNPVCADPDGCKLDECKSKSSCRKEEPNRLDVFVMSQCPFGVKGLDAMKEVLDNFKKHKAKLDFYVHYIGDGDAKSGLTAMHGQSEVDENMRQVCAIEHYRKDLKFLDYVWCRNKDYKSADWRACTGASTGIDAAVIEKCFESSQGKELLAKSYAFSKSGGFGASPTWLVNNKHEFSGIDAETIKSNVCKHNELPGCDVTLSGPPQRQQGAADAPAPGCGE